MTDLPDAVAEQDVDRWDQQVDLVVVGLGVAGACAALEAVAAGARVLVVERSGAGGGATALSEGLVYLGGGTEVQVACGHHDTPDQLLAFLQASIPGGDPDRIRAFAQGSVEHHRWLEAHGVPFERRELTTKAVAGHGGEGLLVTGNEFVHPFRDITPPVPRGHQVRASAEEHGGVVLMRALLGALERTEVEVVHETRATALVTGADGRVRGVRVRHGGADRFVEAARGVVVATGSYNLDAEMVATYLPVLSEHGTPLGTPDNDGEGIRLAASAGAATENLGGAISTAPIYPPEQLLRGITVNARGERFVAEDSYSGRMAYLVEHQPGHAAYLVLDEESFAYPVARPHRLLGAWETSEEVESAVGLPAGSLGRTLAEYNSSVREHGEDRLFGKATKWLRELTGPLAVFDISLQSSEYRFMALGGLRVDVDGRCLDEAGAPVEGLYAAGACAAHLPTNGMEYASGLSIGPGSFFARRAARHALDGLTAAGR